MKRAPCLDCGTPTTLGPRCSSCVTPRPSRIDRGLDADHQRVRRQVIAEETHCWVCEQRVDKSLPGTHPDGPTADHLIRRADGGTNVRENYRLAHLKHNSGRR